MGETRIETKKTYIFALLLPDVPGPIPQFNLAAAAAAAASPHE